MWTWSAGTEEPTMRSEPEKSDDFDPFFAPDPGWIEREKKKARKLRDSAWWKKKKSTGKCHYCGQSFKPAELTMDHIIPLSRGGSSEKSNIVACCKECNSKKKYYLPHEWQEYLDGLKESAATPSQGTVQADQ